MRGSDPEKGATLVEYALLVALIAGLGLSSIQWLTKGATDRYSSVATAVAEPANRYQPEDPPSATSAPAATTTPVTTTKPATTTTTKPATTTTTAPQVVSSVAFTGSSSWSTGWFQWAGSADVEVTDAGGRALSGAEVQVRLTTSTGATTTVTVTTDANGQATVPVGPYTWYGSWGGTGSVGLSVVTVEPASGTWDGARPGTTVSAP